MRILQKVIVITNYAIRSLYWIAIPSLDLHNSISGAAVRSLDFNNLFSRIAIA